MGGFVFKQRGTDSRAPKASLPGLTVRHLQYIATRPGAVFNPECGYSLWGSLEQFAPAKDIQSLDRAKQLLRAEMERGRTVYRAVISLGEPEAGERGYYERTKWVRLVNAQVAEIAKGLNIAPANFRWMASMHYAEGHPHVHLLYWDAGNEPRQEYIPKEQFTAFSERIRANLNRMEFGQEIQTAQQEQSQAAKQLRLELRALCLECNPPLSLDIKSLYRDEKQLDELTRQMETLIRDLPRTGSLKYAYLPTSYREALNAMTDKITELPQCRTLLEQYLESARKVSQLYGNGEQAQQEQQDKAMEKLRRELGNEILSSVREFKGELEADAPTTPDEIRGLGADAVRLIPAEDYARLLSMLPKERISWQAMRELPEFQAAKKEVLNEMLDDARVRLRLNAYAKTMETDNQTAAKSDSQSYKKAYAEFFQAADNELCAKLREDAGYTEEAYQTSAVSTVCGVVAMLARLSRQQQATASLSAKRIHSRDLSREAMKDRAQQQSQSNDWEPDF